MEEVGRELRSVSFESAASCDIDVGNLQKWIRCICVVNFDLEVGQTLGHSYPPNELNDSEESRVCFLSFPDSNSAAMGDTYFTIRIPCLEEPVPEPNPNSSADYSGTFGVVAFRQHRDASLKRGYFQRSLLLMSRLPHISLFHKMMRVIAPLYFDNGDLLIDAACKDIANWPAPVCGESMSLCLFGTQLSTYINPSSPPTEPFLSDYSVPSSQTLRISKGAVRLAAQVEHQKQNSNTAGVITAATDSNNSNNPQQSTTTTPSNDNTATSNPANSSNAQILDVLHETLETKGPGLFQSSKLFTTFRFVIQDLWHIWELALCGRSMLVTCPSVMECSETVLSIVSLIAPVAYAGDYRPYFTIHDKEFHTLTNPSAKRTSTQNHKPKPNTNTTTNTNTNSNTNTSSNTTPTKPSKPSAAFAAAASSEMLIATTSNTEGDLRMTKSEGQDTLTDDSNNNNNNNPNNSQSSNDNHSHNNSSSSNNNNNNGDDGSWESLSLKTCGVLLGVTNPFFLKMASNWPCVLSLSQSVPFTKGKGKAAIPDTSECFLQSQIRSIASPHKPTLRMLMDNGPDTDQAMIEINNALLRRHFTALMKEFLSPFEYFFTWTAPRNSNVYASPPKLPTFDRDGFLLRVKTAGSTELPLLLAITGTPNALMELYHRFLCSVHFKPWFHQRRLLAVRQFQKEACKRCGVPLNLSHKLTSTRDVQLLDMYAQIRARMEKVAGQPSINELLLAKLARRIDRIRDLLPSDITDRLQSPQQIVRNIDLTAFQEPFDKSFDVGPSPRQTDDELAE